MSKRIGLSKLNCNTPDKKKKFDVGAENYNTQNQPCTNCNNLNELIEINKNQTTLIQKLIEDNSILVEKLTNIQEITQNQNKTIVGMLAEHKVELQHASQREKDVAALMKKFPIKNTEDLEQINGEINDINENQYIKTMKHLIGGDLAKNMENILTRAVCIDYNADGICGKKSLKEFKRFFEAMIGAVGHTSANPGKDLRKALQVVKKRHFRLVSSRNKGALDTK